MAVRRFTSKLFSSAPTSTDLVKRTIEGGDAFFPAFEDKFTLIEEIADNPVFKILRYGMTRTR